MGDTSAVTRDPSGAGVPGCPAVCGGYALVRARAWAELHDNNGVATGAGGHGVSARGAVLNGDDAGLLVSRPGGQ